MAVVNTCVKELNDALRAKGMKFKIMPQNGMIKVPLPFGGNQTFSRNLIEDVNDLASHIAKKHGADYRSKIIKSIAIEFLDKKE